jgi:hypothetical protein
VNVESVHGAVPIRVRSIHPEEVTFLTFCLRMIFPENRFPLFGIMR